MLVLARVKTGLAHSKVTREKDRPRRNLPALGYWPPKPSEPRMARYTCLPPGEGSALCGRRLPRPHHLARFSLWRLAEPNRSQGACRRHTPAARSLRWRDNPARPSQVGRCTAPSSTVTSPEQLAFLRSGQLAPSPWSPETRTCLSRLPRDGTYVGSKP
ncbi:hypothetical protein BHE74_00029361 [Ensete ventricosum]|nr:hypothetical protein BHE74_00029361 [Ensete ventricosum]